jgi:Fic family protein
MVRRFVWERERWPALEVDLARLAGGLVAASHAGGRVAGALGHVGRGNRATLEAEALAETAIDTSEIEGLRLDADRVRASLARRLHMPNTKAAARDDPDADGIVSVTLDAIRNARRPLTATRLCDWQRSLFPNPPSALTVGAWRRAADDPMQVVSGPVSARRIHFEAPPAARVPDEMRRFIAWFEGAHEAPALVTAALAHVRFETIHPFADGNGRIGRAIADLALAREDPETAPYVSLSREILRDKSAYYAALERAQRGDADVTEWAAWFIDAYRKATETTLAAISGLQRASAFWREHADIDLNARQRRVIERYLGGGFDGWINSRKYAAIAKTSADTAARDLADLVEKRVIVPNEGRARRTSYRLSDERP